MNRKREIVHVYCLNVREKFHELGMFFHNFQMRNVYAGYASLGGFMVLCGKQLWRIPFTSSLSVLATLNTMATT